MRLVICLVCGTGVRSVQLCFMSVQEKLSVIIIIIINFFALSEPSK